MELLLVAAALLLFLFACAVPASTPAPLLGIYHRPHPFYWPKYLLLASLLRMRQAATTFTRHFLSFRDIDDVSTDTCCPYKEAASVSFCSANDDGWYLFVGAATSSDVTDYYFLLNVPGVGLFTAPSATPASRMTLHQMRTGPVVWRLQYSGQVVHAHSHMTSHMTLDAVWASSMDAFHVYQDAAANAAAQGLALERWTRRLWGAVASLLQSPGHLQHGRLHARLSLDSCRHMTTMSGACDVMDTRHVYRYVIHHVTLEDHTCVSVGVVSAPAIMSRLDVGCVRDAKGDVTPVTSCDLQLWRLGEGGKVCANYGLTYMAGGQMYQMQVQLQTQHTVTWRGGGRRVLCPATVVVNGIRGRGASLWLFPY